MVMGNNPSRYRECGEQCPIEQVSWFDAIEFCNRLSQREGLSKCYRGGQENVVWDRSCTGYRLPTEAEWEYSARAGSTTTYPCGELHRCLLSMAWTAMDSGPSPRPVGTKLANAWYLYDTIGNVWEWVWDWYSLFTPEPLVDPSGPEHGIMRAYRGGCFSLVNVNNLRSAKRKYNSPDKYYYNLGFRLAQSLEQ